MIGLTIFVVSLVCILFWMALSTQISSGIRWIRVMELSLASLFTDRYDVLLAQLKSLAPEQIRPYYILKMTEATMEFYKYPIMIIMFIMAGFSYFFIKERHPFARRFDLEGIAKEQASAFPVTMPVVKFNPLNAHHRPPGSPVPARLPPFAEALAPEEWVAFNDIPLVKGIIDRDATRLAFAKQLGRRWKSVNALPLHARALFAAFALKAAGKRTESDDFLGELARHWEPGRGLVLSSGLRKEIARIIDDPKMGRVLAKVAAQHSFTTPALLRCLHVAREQGGVLAPAQFVWLRAVDRPLWYAMNNLGRGAVHIEGAGAIAHFRAEKSAEKPIPNPLVDVAIDGLMDYLKENYVTQFPAKEYTNKTLRSTKRNGQKRN